VWILDPYCQSDKPHFQVDGQSPSALKVLLLPPPPPLLLLHSTNPNRQWQKCFPRWIGKAIPCKSAPYVGYSAEIVELSARGIAILRRPLDGAAKVVERFAKELVSWLTSGEKSQMLQVLKSKELIPKNVNSVFAAAIALGLGEELSCAICDTGSQDAVERRFVLDDAQQLVEWIEGLTSGEYLPLGLRFFETARVVAQSILFRRPMSNELRHRAVAASCRIENFVLRFELEEWRNSNSSGFRAGSDRWLVSAREAQSRRLQHPVTQLDNYLVQRGSGRPFADLLASSLGLTEMTYDLALYIFSSASLFSQWGLLSGSFQ